MKRLIIFFLILVIAVLIGIAVKIDPGYVLIAYRQWTAEMPLWFAIVSLCLLFVLLHALLIAWRSIKNFSAFYRIRRKLLRTHRPYILTRQGLFAFLHHDLKKAEKLLTKGLRHNRLAPINNLVLAAIAHEKHQPKKAEQAILAASRSASEEQMLINVLQAHLFMKNNEWPSALTLLQNLQAMEPENPLILNALKTVYIHLHQWRDLAKIYPLLQDLGEAEKDKDLLLAYCRGLNQSGQPDEALKMITHSLNKKWEDTLCELYGTIHVSNTAKQLKVAEKWLKNEPRNSMLYLTLGRLANRLNEWHDAESYLISSVQLKESREAYLELAYLYTAKNENEKALEMFRKANLLTD